MMYPFRAETVRRALSGLHRTVFAAVFAGAIASAAGPVSAQRLIDQLDRAELDRWRIAEGNKISFCQFKINLTNDFDKAFAEALAERLLLESNFVMLGTIGYGIDGDGLEVDIFKELTNRCEVVLGMQVGANMYVQEFTVTRPYVSYDYKLIVADPEIRALDDLPGGAKIGTQLGTDGDMALGRDNATRPDDKQWLRLPFADVNMMMERVVDGSNAGMLVFGPVYAMLARQRPEEAAKLHEVPLPPSIAASSNIGGLMLARSAFLRVQIDEAIESMIADGTIEQLLQEHGFGEIEAHPGGF